jgi:hypothetical protein
MPKLVSGDLNTLPETASTTATLFRTTLLADVRPVNDDRGVPHYRLKRVGIRLCTPVKGVDTVVSSDSLERLGLDLGMVAGYVLERAEQEVAKGRLIARTPTFAVLSSPVDLRVVEGHRHVLLRYALLVEPETGALRTTVCAVSAEPDRRRPVPRVALLPPGLIYDSEVDVLASRLLGTVPFNWSFAVRSLPPGRSMALPPDLQARFIRDVFSPQETAAFEIELRRTLDKVK